MNEAARLLWAAAQQGCTGVITRLLATTFTRSIECRQAAARVVRFAEFPAKSFMATTPPPPDARPANKVLRHMVQMAQTKSMKSWVTGGYLCDETTRILLASQD